MLLHYTLLLGADPKPHNKPTKRALFSALRTGGKRHLAWASRPKRAPWRPRAAANVRSTPLRGPQRLRTLLLASCHATFAANGYTQKGTSARALLTPARARRLPTAGGLTYD